VLLYNFMFIPGEAGLPLEGACPSCTSIIDAVEGEAPHRSSELFFAPTEPGLHPRHVDFIWPLWAVLDLTPEGRGTDWGPQLEYR
jgi:predicted dithiol-disulfide oxidoreductase (DUF899 family)